MVGGDRRAAGAYLRLLQSLQPDQDCGAAEAHDREQRQIQPDEEPLAAMAPLDVLDVLLAHPSIRVHAVARTLHLDEWDIVIDLVDVDCGVLVALRRVACLGELVPRRINIRTMRFRFV